MLGKGFNHPDEWHENLFFYSNPCYDEKQLKQMPVLLENEILTSWLHMGVSLNGGIPKTPQNDHFQ